MADSNIENVKPIHFKRRLGEGMNVELVFTPFADKNNLTNDGTLSSTSNDEIPAIRIPTIQQSDNTTDVDDDGFVHLDLVNFTGRLSFRRTETVEEDGSGVTESPPQCLENTSVLEEPSIVSKQAYDLPLPKTSSSVPDSQSDRMSTTSNDEDSVVDFQEHKLARNDSSISVSLHDTSSIRFHLPSMPDTTRVERDQTVSPLSSTDVKAIGKTDAKLNGGKFPFLRSRTKPEDSGSVSNRKSTSSAISNALRYRRNKRPSMFTIMKRESLKSFPTSLYMGQACDESDGQTDLHALVSSTELTLQKMETMIERFPDSVRTVDAKGRLPLHVLGSNSELINYAEGQAIAKQCAILLMELYPVAIVTKDADGKMPFTYLIEKWVEWTHQQHAAKSLSKSEQDSSSEAIKGVFRKIFRSNLFFLQMEEAAVMEGSNSMSSLSDSSNRFPLVMIFEEVEWSFEMLSLAMDHLGGMPLDQNQNMRPNLSHKKQRQDRLALATNVASIPQLLKTTMLLDSNETRNKILDSSVIHRALLCSEVIGPWLTSMMRYRKGTSSTMAIGFLAMLSQLSVEDYVGKYRKVLPLDEELFKADRLKVYKAVEHLRDIVPSLLILPNDLLDKAIATPVIWFCMNRHTTKPFSVGMSATDLQLQITTVVAVRQGLFLLNAGEGRSNVFPFLRIVSVVFFGCFFQVIRILCEALALNRISTHVSLRYCLDPWRILHFVGAFAALWASVQIEIRIRSGFYDDENNLNKDEPPIVVAIIVGLLWFSVLGFLKAVNESLATFILALTRIFFDIRFFCIVLLVFILMFGDMFYILYLGDTALIAECSSNDPSDPASDFCNERPIYSYLRVYAMMIEDFSLADYEQSAAQTVLWLCVTFVGFVVMMNTLIAVITRSYENSHNSSIILFRRARCEFVASNAAIEGFLRPEFFDHNSTRTCDLGSSLLVLARWILLVTFFVTIGFSSLYIIQRLVEMIEAENWLATIGTLVLSLIMAFNLWSALVFILNAGLRMCSGRWAENTRNYFLSINQYLVNKMARQIYGIDVGNLDGGEMIGISEGSGLDKELQNRIDRLEKTLERLAIQQVATGADSATSSRVSIAY